MSRDHVRPKAVLFDLDGTLFDRNASFLELVQDQHDRFAAELELVPREVFVRRVVEMDGHGYVDRHVVYRELTREFCLPETTGERLKIHFRDAYASYSRCFPEVPSALADLHALGMKLGIITNGSTSMQEQKIRQLGIADLMDEVLISEREGVRKPDRRIFERALERLDVVPAGKPGMWAITRWLMCAPPLRLGLRRCGDSHRTGNVRRFQHAKFTA